MTLLPIALALAAGVLIGLRIKHRRFLTERQKRTDAEAKVDMYDRNALRTDHDVCGPVQPKPVFHDIDPDEVEQDVVLDVPDRQSVQLNGTIELVERHDIEPDGYCPVEGHHVEVGRRDYYDWWVGCSCGYEADHLPHQAKANQVAQAHRRTAESRDVYSFLDHPDELSAWGSAIDADDDTSSTGPRSVPGPRVSD